MAPTVSARATNAGHGNDPTTVAVRRIWATFAATIAGTVRESGPHSSRTSGYLLRISRRRSLCHAAASDSEEEAGLGAAPLAMSAAANARGETRSGVRDADDEGTGERAAGERVKAVADVAVQASAATARAKVRPIINTEDSGCTQLDDESCTWNNQSVKRVRWIS